MVRHPFTTSPRLLITTVKMTEQGKDTELWVLADYGGEGRLFRGSDVEVSREGWREMAGQEWGQWRAGRPDEWPGGTKGPSGQVWQKLEDSVRIILFILRAAESMSRVKPSPRRF